MPGTVYPNAIDDTTTLPQVVDNVTEVTQETVNRLRDAIVHIETELGVLPRGVLATVRARLDGVDTNLSALNVSIANVITEVNAIIASLDGEGIKLGTPTGGFTVPGITTLVSTTPITEAINTFNNIMSYLAPAQPHSIDGLAIEQTASYTTYSGKVADVSGHSSGYFKSGHIAGDATYAITKTQAFILTTHNTGDATTGFSDADKGILSILHGDGASASTTTFNLGAAFDEAHRADLNGQGTTYAGGTGSNAPANLLVLPSPTYPVPAVIKSIALFNGFPLWQKGVVLITNTTLTPGYNYFQVKHIVNATTRNSALYELFYDNGSTNPSFAATPSFTISSQTVYNYLSGIRYLTTTDTMLLSATINNAFVNTYLQVPITYSFTAGIPGSTSDLADPSLTVGPTGTSSAPNSTDHVTINKIFTITAVNQQTVNCIASISYANIYGANFPAVSGTQNILINTYNSPTSGETSEAFVDENRRLKPDINGATGASSPYPADYIGIPPSITGQWDSTATLGAADAQSFNAKLVYPNINFSTGYAPTQTPNYSGHTGGQVYYRAFRSTGNPHSQGTISIGGVIGSDVTGGSPNIQVELKLPGSSGWKNLAQPFNSGTFVLATNWTIGNGQGCLVGAPTAIGGGTAFSWSMGTGTTATSGFMYIIRITLFNATKPITFLSESFI